MDNETCRYARCEEPVRLHGQCLEHFLGIPKLRAEEAKKSKKPKRLPNQCLKCHKVKTPDDFYNHNRHTGAGTGPCKKCAYAEQKRRARAKANRNWRR